MVRELGYLRETPSQTAGPYVHIGLAPGAAGFSIFEQELGRDIAGPEAPGEHIRVEGLVIDGTGAPVKDALLEVWQADASGVYPHPEDPVLGLIEQPQRVATLIATGTGAGAYRFDIRLQGDGETVFLDL